MGNRSYKEILSVSSYLERLEYLQLGDNNVDSPKHMSNEFYTSKPWRLFRQSILERDLGFDLGVFNVDIPGIAIVHHINPITEYDIIHSTRKLMDPNNVITTSIETHNKIHYNKKEILLVERKPGDTKLW